MQVSWVSSLFSRKARPMEAWGIINTNIGPTSVLSGKLIPSRLEDTHPREQVLSMEFTRKK